MGSHAGWTVTAASTIGLLKRGLDVITTSRALVHESRAIRGLSRRLRMERSSRVAEELRQQGADAQASLVGALIGKCLFKDDQDQACGKCNTREVRAVGMSAFVVYLRCQACGDIWNIPQRRSVRRPTDPRRF